MSDTKSKAYEDVRKAFDALKMEERATFVVESVVAMLTDGVGEAGRVVSDLMDEMAANVDRVWKERCDDDAKGTGDGAAAAASGAKKSGGKTTGRSAGAKTPGSRRARGSAKKTSDRKGDA